MQADLQDSYPILNIQIVGLNEIGHDIANDQMVNGRTIPWLQDVDSDGNQVSDVWYDSWDVVYRDVIILDGQNETVGTYNLTVNDIGNSANYSALRDMLVDAAMTEQKPFQNHNDRFDINADGFVVPNDVLIMINEINTKGALELAPPTGASIDSPFWDCNGDNFFSPVDILQVINFIDIEHNAGEGEASDESTGILSVTTFALQETSFSEIESDARTQPITIDSTPESTDVFFSANESMRGASNDDSVQSVESPIDDFWAAYWGDE